MTKKSPSLQSPRTAATAQSRQQRFAFAASSDTQHGGDHCKGRRKTARPIDPKRSLHLTLRSAQARGAWSMLSPKHCEHLERLTREIAEKRGIRIYRFVNVGNHLHLLVKTPSRRAFRAFLRELAGTIAILITGAGKGRALKARFWDKLAWTRIVNWGRDFNGLALYLVKNIFQASGMLTREERRAGWKVVSLSFDPPP